ncbi:MAG TPA: DPP IV N-terminal domain-containing protein [Anaerolineae bacterium]|nr:DPP IV N-terminal domain-containing protein [Anaerolineae bacterium]
MDKPMGRPKEFALKRWLKALARPRAVQLPILFWICLFALMGVLIRLATLPQTATPVYLPGETHILVATPTPGAPLALAPTPTPVGSGGTLAFTMRHNGNDDIYLLSQNDRQLLRLTYDPAADRDPAWSPDGRWLAFASQRASSWDLYLMDMQSGTVLRLTRDPSFEARPSWSPDSQWLAYEVYDGENFDIYVLSVDGEQKYRLTNHPAPDFSPAWSPDGRHIAFTSLRDGSKDIHVISLDTGEVINLTQSQEQQEDYAAWSPDGAFLSYSAGTPGNEEILVLPFDKDAIAMGEVRPMLFGTGGQPTWSPDGQALAFIYRRNERSYLVAANISGWALAQEGYSSSNWMAVPSWSQHVLPVELAQQLAARMAQPESPLYTELLLDTEAHPTTYKLVGLPGVNNGDTTEKLSDRVNDSFNALRQRVKEETGWDYLSILGDSWRPMNHTPRPGQGRISWHVCGRAIDINQGFLSDGLIELIREDIGGVTYWRVYIKAAKQDGSLGEPLRDRPWNLSARSKGGLAAVQGGELKSEVPQGYYVDFTTLAADYGWERRNALSGWRTSWFDIEWWHFQKTAGLSWYQCMLELYDEDAISASYGDLPWWTRRPEWEVQTYPW